MSSNIRVQKICQHCGIEFIAKTTVTKYCGDKCAKKAYKARKRAEKLQAAKKETKIVRLKPIESLNIKPFLSIAETCQLLGVSRSTLHRMIKRGELTIGKLGNRTIIQRSEVNKFFEQEVQIIKPTPKPIDREDCYYLREIQEKFNITEKTLYQLIERENIPKIQKGKYCYVPKQPIDQLLS